MIFLTYPGSYWLKFELGFYYTLFPDMNYSTIYLTTSRKQIDFSLIHVVGDNICGSYLDSNGSFIDCNDSTQYKKYLTNLKTFGVGKIWN